MFNHLDKAKLMKQNVGGIDRAVRVATGVALIALAVTGTVGAWGWVGVVPLATGLAGWCPPYALFGWNTCSTKPAKA
jgi:O-antigen ligase